MLLGKSSEQRWSIYRSEDVVNFRAQIKIEEIEENQAKSIKGVHNIIKTVR